VAKEVTVTATQDQWQWVMWYLTNFIMPDKLGDKVYKPVERARIQEEISAVFDALLPHSHYAQQHGADYFPHFGAKEDWAFGEEPRQPGVAPKPTNPGRLYAVAFGQKATSGLLWLFTVLLTPPEKHVGPDGKPMATHPYLVTPSLASRFIWPITKQLGKVVALKRSVGIEESPLHMWEDDPAVTEVAR
jgi:hypothetical protein